MRVPRRLLPQWRGACSAGRAGGPRVPADALVGAPVGAGLAAGEAIHRPSVVKTPLALAVSPVLGAVAAWRSTHRAGRRDPVRGGERTNLAGAGIRPWSERRAEVRRADRRAAHGGPAARAARDDRVR